MAKMTMKQWEKSAADKKLDKKLGYKEGSPKDRAADKKALAKVNGKPAFRKGGAVKGKCGG